jgi:hypothetical protein
LPIAAVATPTGEDVGPVASAAISSAVGNATPGIVLAALYASPR